MKFSALSKTGFAAALCATLSSMSGGVQAGTLQDTIFAKVESSGFARDRMFFRLSYINVNVKTTAKDAYDVTGPVLVKGDVTAMANDPNFVSYFVVKDSGDSPPWSSAAALIDGTGSSRGNPGALEARGDYAATGCASYLQGLGTPCGFKAKGSTTVGTAAVSIGYFFDEARNWSVESFLLAAPVQADVYGDGKTQLNGKKIITTKLLPPIVLLGRHFGAQSSEFRPYLGLAASYAIFYDTKATSSLNDYQGGGSPGDTTIRIKNTFGFGPFVGFKYEPKDSGWFASFSVGKVRYKTDTTITTNNTTIKDSSPVLKDYGPWFQYAVNGGAVIINNNGGLQTGSTPPQGYAANQAVGITTALMCDLANYKFGSESCNMGTYERKASNVLDNTMFMFSVGRTF